jgi:hypothetical protein
MMPGSIQNEIVLTPEALGDMLYDALNQGEVYIERPNKWSGSMIDGNVDLKRAAVEFRACLERHIQPKLRKPR